MHDAQVDIRPGGRPVMCAVDASEEAGAVVATGARLSALLGAPLVLFHVARPPGRWHGVDRVLHPDRQADDRREGQRLLREHAAGIPVGATLELTTGAPAEEVLMAAEDVEPELLVIGSHGRRALRSLLGSVSRDVTRWTTQATLVVPDGADDRLRAAGPVLCGVDDSEESGRAAALAARLAHALGGQLVLVSVLDAIPTAAPTVPAAMPVGPPPDVSEERRARRRAQLEEVAHPLRAEAPVQTMVEVGDPATRLIALGHEFDAVLIAVGNVDHWPLTAAFGSAIASDLVASAARPVLLVP
jgi:nucleotide-binding universal stress UspA family protein